MSLTIGARVGSFEITAALGAGGMGEVWRAHDTKLDRDVALKVLPASFAQDSERLARLQREAKVLAGLNHPHVAQIYCLEESQGFTGLVLELVEGPTLADLLARGALATDEALAIGLQIAEALETAHEQGIVHRDLKPANIKVRPDGAVKVLDFGLAKALDEAGDAVLMGLSQAPTLTAPALRTSIGTLLGTAAYMSPEQVRSIPVDRRADIWAFGCLMYEMLTGRRAFGGRDVAETLAAVLTSDPDWSRLPEHTPIAIARLIQRCVERDIKRRVPNMSVARFEIAEHVHGTASTGSPAQAFSARAVTSRRSLGLAAAAALVGACAAGVAVWWLTKPESAPVVHLAITPVQGDPAGTASGNPDVAISADGTHVAFTTGTATAGRLYIRALNGERASMVSAGGTPAAPFFSPDGQWVGFWEVGNWLKKVPVSGGPAVPIAQLTGQIRGAAWSTDGRILFGMPGQGLMQVPAGGGTPEVLTRPDASQGEATHVFPEVLPGGRAVLFTIVNTEGRVDQSKIAVLDLRSGQRKVILEGGFNPRYARSGHILYASAQSIRAVAFDINALQPRGDSVTVVDDVWTKPSSSAANFAISANGTLAYLSGNGNLERSLVWVNRNGFEEALAAPPRAYVAPRLSPDGNRIAIDVRDRENDIWIFDIGRRGLSRLTLDPTPNRGVVWTPDGSRVAFSAVRDGRENVYWQAADGTGSPERLTSGVRAQIPSGFSPDGQWLLFSEPGITPMDTGVQQLSGERHSELILHSGASERNAEISPDGRWLVYCSDESGRDEIYVRPFPRVEGGRWQVSTDGGTRPMWSRNGREIFYYRTPGRMYSAMVDAGASFAVSEPRLLFAGDYSAPQNGRNYDVSADGTRFLMIKEAPRSSRELAVVLNWFEELRRRVPEN